MILNIGIVIALTAAKYNLSAPLLTEMCHLESNFDPNAVGDNGDAHGLWQWHLASWKYVREKMGKSTEDLRFDPVESTETAAYAMSHLGLWHWWSTYPIALKNIKGSLGVVE